MYAEKGYTATLDGLKALDGTPAYKVIIGPLRVGSKLIKLLRQNTGLKNKNENAASGDTFYSIIK